MEQNKIHIKRNPIATYQVKNTMTVLPNDYALIENKPKINGTTLVGSLSSEELQVLSNKLEYYEVGTGANLNDEDGSLILLKHNSTIRVPSSDLMKILSVIDNGQSIDVEDDGEFAKELMPNIFYNFIGKLTMLMLTLSPPSSTRENEYKGQFKTIVTIPTIVFPSDVRWIGDEFPELELGKTYQFSILNKIGVIVGV